MAHVSTGLDGQSSIWPEKAVSRDAKGIFRDFKGRRVAAVAMDSATPAMHLVAKPARKVDGNDEEADAQAMKTVRGLLPQLLKMLKAEAVDSTEEEADDLGLSGEDSAVGESVLFNEATEGYQAERAKWFNINKRNAERRGQGYAPVAIIAGKAS